MFVINLFINKLNGRYMETKCNKLENIEFIEFTNNPRAQIRTRVTEGKKLQQKVVNNPSQLSIIGRIEEYDENLFSSIPNSELSSDDSTTFSDSDDEIVDVTICDYTKNRNVSEDRMFNSTYTQDTTTTSTQDNISNQEFRLTDETFLEILSCAKDYLSMKLSEVNDKSLKYGQDITKNIILFRHVIKEFTEDIHKKDVKVENGFI